MSDSYRSTHDVAGSAGATQPLQADKSLGDLFGEMSSDLGVLFRKEVELAKVEARDEAKKAGKAAGMFGAAGLGGLMAVLFISLALAWLLDQAMNRALAFLIVAVLWGVVAFVLVTKGKKELQAVKPLPETVQTLKEDVQWAKTQKN